MHLGQQSEGLGEGAERRKRQKRKQRCSHVGKNLSVPIAVVGPRRRLTGMPSLYFLSNRLRTKAKQSKAKQTLGDYCFERGIRMNKDEQ